MSGQRREVLIRVTNGALIVANDGRPFSRLGVLSLCASDLSEKSGRDDEQPEDYPDTSDEELLQAIANCAISVYRADSNRPKRDLRHERGVTADYGGRYLWELIQNADDALADDAADAAELIGTKGLGFISVLEITDRPEIFSRPFAFYFSKGETEVLLRTRLGKQVRAPTFEIPHPAVVTPEIADVLQRGYATAIRLPFRNAEIAAKVRDAVERLDDRFLLLSQHIQRLQIDVPGRYRTINVGRSLVAPGIEEITFSARDRGEIDNVCRWTKWFDHWEQQEQDKRLSVAVCLPKGPEGGPHALSEDDMPPVHMFFPTDERIGLRAIMHASLDVTENRKYFRDGERNAHVYPRMRKLVAKILDAVPAEIALDAFGGVDPKTGTGAARELASTVLGAVTETAFVPVIGGGKVRPHEVKLWTGRFGTVLKSEARELQSYNLLHPSVNDRNTILEGLDAKETTTADFFGAMRFCRNGSPAECRSAVNVLVSEGLPRIDWQYHPDWFAQVPCWWTEIGGARPIAGRILLYSQPPEWPKFIEADALSSETRRHLAKIEGGLPADAPLKRSQGVWREYVVKKFVHKDEYLERALLPAMAAMKPADWDEHGWDILRWYREWSPERKFDGISGLPIIWEDRLNGEDVFRRKLSRTLRLPTDKGWRPAEQCYAERTWGAPKSFRAFFCGVEDRAVVRPLRVWREPARGAANLEDWKGLLRFAGVAWEPKLVRAGLDTVSARYHRQCVPEFNRCDFDLRIEHFPECLASETRLLALLNAGKAVLASAGEYPAKWVLPQKQKPQTLKTNFAEHQLAVEAWLPHRKSLLFPQGLVAASDAYLAGKGIEGLLPEIAIPDVEPRLKNDLLRFLNKIGINDELPTDGSAWINWMKRLADASRRPDADKRVLLDVAKMLYRRLFNSAIGEIYGSPTLRVPCFVGGEAPEHLTFVFAREARWLDEPIFEAPDIRRQILAHGYRLFIRFLSQAEGADRHLGVRRLSEAVSLTPVSAGVDEEATADVAAHYRSRIHALRAVLPEAQRPLLSPDLRIEATSNLSISIRAEDGKEIVTARVRAFRNRHGTLITAEEGSHLGALGMGLAHYVVGNPKHTAIFENILTAADEAGVIGRLRDHGIPAQELDAVQEAMANEKASPPTASAGTVDEADAGTQQAAAASQQATAAAHPAPADPTPPGRLAPATTASARPTAEQPAQKKAAVVTGQTAIRVERLGAGTWATRSAGNWNPQAAAEAGQHAEDWLYARLIAAFPGRPIVRRERDAANRESDFVIHLDGQAFHIEAKRLGTLPGYVYWSDLEFAKCSDLGDNYCLAVLLPSAEEYEIAWIWQPATELANAERFVDWIWEGRRSDQLPDGIWRPSTPPAPMPPRSFTYRITLTGMLLNSLPKDSSDLSLLNSRIAGLPGTWPAKTAAGQ